MVTSTLSIQSLKKSYKGKLVNDIMHLTFQSGQVVALLGHNGAGKTTLLNQIVGLVHPDQGEILYNGQSLLADDKLARSVISVMPQLHAPLQGVTLRQSIATIYDITGGQSSQKDQRVISLLEELDIRKWENQQGEKLSGGLKRLTSFAMTVVNPAPIILLDEPTNDVDPVRRKKLWMIIKNLAKEGHIIIVVTHNLSDVTDYCDRFVLLSNGRVVKDDIINHLISTTHYQIKIMLRDNKALDQLPVDVKMTQSEASYLLKFDKALLSTISKWLTTQLTSDNLISYQSDSQDLSTLYEELSDDSTTD